MTLPVVALVPMKSLEASKSRLSATLGAEQRQALALNMLRRVLRAARGPLDHVWVIGGDSAVHRAAIDEGAIWHSDPTPDLNSCLGAAIRLAHKQRLSALYLPGDLPLLDSEEVRCLTQASRNGAKAILVPDIRGEGTNAVLLPIGSPFTPSLGPGSFPRHLKLTSYVGMEIAIYHSSGLGFDLDTLEDLDALSRRRPGLVEELARADRTGIR